MRRWLVVVVLALTACGSGGPSKADQGRSIADRAGLAPDVADFFALAVRGLDATYRVTLSTVDTNGKPLQLTTTQRPPDARFDAFHDDGTIDSTIMTGGRTYQCTMAANHWDCGELGATASGGQVFGPDAVKAAVDRFEQRAADYDFRVEPRSMAGTSARCLVTTRKPGKEQDPAIGASATLCLSNEGVILLVAVPSGSLTATAYSTEIPPDAFTLPATPSSASASSSPSSSPPSTAAPN